MPSSFHPTCSIGEGALLGEGTTIGAFCVIGDGCRLGEGVTVHPLCCLGRNVEIGDGAVLYPGVVILDGVRVGRGAVLQSGSVLGTDGFGYVNSKEEHYKIPQIGTVEIGDGVRIGANTCVDRATSGTTRVGEGSELGNLVQIGHNVQIGKRCVLESQVGMAGSGELEDGVALGAQTGVARVKVGSGVTALARSGITKSVPPGSRISGFPARPVEETEAIDRCVDLLPELAKKWKREPA